MPFGGWKAFSILEGMSLVGMTGAAFGAYRIAEEWPKAWVVLSVSLGVEMAAAASYVIAVALGHPRRAALRKLLIGVSIPVSVVVVLFLAAWLFVELIFRSLHIGVG